MPTRQPGNRWSAPLPPEPPAEPSAVEHRAVASYDLWEDERVVDADLAGQVADQVRFTRCELQGVVLTGAQLRGLGLVDVLAVECELSGSFLHEASWLRVELRNCRLSGVVISQATLRHVRFVDCKLDGANLRFVRAEHLEMSGCSLTEADFYEAVLTHSALDGCDLQRSDFSKASVAGLRLGGSKLDGLRGATSMSGAVIGGDQVLPLALSLLGELQIDVQNDDE